MTQSKKYNLEKSNIKKDWLKPIITGFVIALITTMLNYFLFINQFKVNYHEKIFDKKVQLLDETSRAVFQSLRNIPKRTDLDYYYDILYKHWCDSLKLNALPISTHKLFLKKLETEHPQEYEAADKLETSNQELISTLTIDRLFFENPDVLNKIDEFLNTSDPTTRRNLYTKYRDQFLSKYKATYNDVNCDIVSDSLLNYYGSLTSNILSSMSKEIDNH